MKKIMILEISLFPKQLHQSHKHLFRVTELIRRILSHLDFQQRETLLNLLDSFSDCFSDIPGLCSLVEHTVPLMDNFIPKQLSPYKIPVRLRPEVQAQLQELQSLEIIHPSKSPMASPVIHCIHPSG